MLAAFITLIIVAALAFVNIYGPRMITLLLQDIEERRQAARREEISASELEAQRGVDELNAQLRTAFGTSDESRRIENSLRYITTMREAAKTWLARETVDEEAATELYVECEWFDDEIDVVLSDDTLSQREKCDRVLEILERSK